MSRKFGYSTKIPRLDGGGNTTDNISSKIKLKPSTETSNAPITSRINISKPTKLKIQNTHDSGGGNTLRNKIMKRFTGKSNICSSSSSSSSVGSSSNTTTTAAIITTIATTTNNKTLNQPQQNKTIENPQNLQRSQTFGKYEDSDDDINAIGVENLTSTPLVNQTIKTTPTAITKTFVNDEELMSINYLNNFVQVNDTKKTSTPTEQKKSSINVTFSGGLEISQSGGDCSIGACGGGGGDGSGEGDETIIVASSGSSYCFGETFDKCSPLGNTTLNDLTLTNCDGGDATFINQDNNNTTNQSDVTFTNKQIQSQSQQQQQQQQQQPPPQFPFMPDLTDCTLDCSIELYDSIASNEISSSHGSPRLKQNINLNSASNHQLLCSQNSFEIDDSFGILTPEQMVEFPDVSMTPRMELFLKFRDNPLDGTTTTKSNQENPKNHLYYLNQPSSSHLYGAQKNHQQQQNNHHFQNHQLPHPLHHHQHHHHDHNHLCQIDQTPSPEELPLDPISVTTTTTDLLMGNYAGVMTSSTDTQNSQNSLRGNSSGSSSVIGQIVANNMISPDGLIITGNDVVGDGTITAVVDEEHEHQLCQPEQNESYSIKTITDPSSTSIVNHGKPLNSFITSITSITSLDTGYQGDGELSRPGSRTAAATGTASGGGGGIGFDRVSPSIILRSDAPVVHEIDSEFYGFEKFDRKHDKQQLLQSHYLYNNQQHHHTDTMTDSDFYTESEADDGNHHNHNNRHHPRAGKRVKKDNTSCLESSGIFTDNDNRADDEIESIEQHSMKNNNYNNMPAENSSYNNNSDNNHTTNENHRLMNDDKKSSNDMTTIITPVTKQQAHFSTTNNINSLSQYSISSQPNSINDCFLPVIAKTKTLSSSSSSSSVVVTTSSSSSSIKTINNSKSEILSKQLLLNSGENNNEIYVGRQHQNYIVTSAAAATAVTPVKTATTTTTSATPAPTTLSSSLECFTDISNNSSSSSNNNDGRGGANLLYEICGATNSISTLNNSTNTNIKNCYKKANNNKNVSARNLNQTLSECGVDTNTVTNTSTAGGVDNNYSGRMENNKKNMNNSGDISMSSSITSQTNFIQLNLEDIDLCNISSGQSSPQRHPPPQLSSTPNCTIGGGRGGGGAGIGGRSGLGGGGLSSCGSNNSGSSNNVTIRKMPPNKWDAVMNKIATNKIKLHKTKKDYNEIKPKVTSGLTKRFMTTPSKHSTSIGNTPLLSPSSSPSSIDGGTGGGAGLMNKRYTPAKRELTVNLSKRGRTKSNTPSPHNHSRSPQNERSTFKHGEKRFGSSIIAPAAVQVNTCAKVKQVTASTPAVAATTIAVPPSTIRKTNKTINIKRTPLKDHNELVLEQLQISPKAQKISPKLSSKCAQTAGTNNNNINNNNNNNNNSNNNNNNNSNSHFIQSTLQPKQQQQHSQPPTAAVAAATTLVVDQQLNKPKKSKELQIIKNATNVVAYATKSTTTEEFSLTRDGQENKNNNDIAALGIVIQYLAFHLDAFNSTNLKESNERAKSALQNTKTQLDAAIANNKNLENNLLQKESMFLDREKDLHKQYELELKNVQKLRDDFEESVTGRIASLEQEIHEKDVATEQELQSHIYAFNIKLAEQEQYIASAKNKESELLKRINVLSSTENELREKSHISENEFGERLRASSIRERELTEKIQSLNGKIQEMEIDMVQLQQQQQQQQQHQQNQNKIEQNSRKSINSEENNITIINNSPTKNESKKIRRKSNNCHCDFNDDSNNLSIEKDKNLRPEMLEEEVKSLRSVLDLKQREISELRKQNQLLDKDSHSLPNALVKISSLESRLEDLQIQLKTKTDDEQEFFQKIKHLEQSLQHEASCRKSLALRNEQLQWKLKQNSEKMKMAIAELSRRYQDHSDFLMETQESLYGVFENNSLNIGTDNVRQVPQQQHQSTSSICDLTTSSSLSVETEPLVKGVVEKNESVSWILEITDEESGEALASRIVRRAGSFRSSLNERINNNGHHQYLNNNQNSKKSPQQQQLLSLLNPISQSASATSILRTYSLDTSPTFQKHSTSADGGGGGGGSGSNIRQSSRLRSKSTSASVTTNTGRKSTTIGGNSPKIEQMASKSIIEWPNECHSRIRSSSPKMKKETLRSDNEDDDDEDDYDDNLELSDIFTDQQQQQINNSNLKMIVDEENDDDYTDLLNKSFRRHNSMKKNISLGGGSGAGGGGGGRSNGSAGGSNSNNSSGSRKQLITCSAAGLSSGIHETNNKKYNFIKESAGEAMVSGTTSDDEDASTTSSSDDSISIGSAQTD